MYLLELNPLVKPGFGLIVWMTLSFFIVMYVLSKYAWKPILAAIQSRENSIDDAITKAEQVKMEMTQLKSENENLLSKAREERATMLKEAKETKDKIVSEAKETAKAEAYKIMADAQQAIHAQKMAALTDVKNQVGKLVIEVSEKILKRELGNKVDQENYIQTLTKNVQLN